MRNKRVTYSLKKQYVQTVNLIVKSMKYGILIAIGWQSLFSIKLWKTGKRLMKTLTTETI